MRCAYMKFRPYLPPISKGVSFGTGLFVGVYLYGLRHASSKAPLSLSPFIVRLRDERLTSSFRTSAESRGSTILVSGSMRLFRSSMISSPRLLGKDGGRPFGLPVGLYVIFSILLHALLHWQQVYHKSEGMGACSVRAQQARRPFPQLNRRDGGSP